MKCFAFALAWGVALCGGSADSQTFTTLLEFSGTGGLASGASPRGSLTLSGTTLYGMTVEGGANGYGNVFSVGVNGTNYENLLSVTGVGGSASGRLPTGNLTLAGTTLYGMTDYGGANDDGTVFSIGADGTDYQNLIAFTGTGLTAAGRSATGSLTPVGTTLYGVTGIGGPKNLGTVFSVGEDGTNFQSLVSFTGNAGTASGAGGIGRLTRSGTTLYGMTNSGGFKGAGTIFSVGTDGTSFRSLVAFTEGSGTAIGESLYGSLTLGGTTLYGMSTGYSNVFSVGTDGTGFRNLFSFPGNANTAGGANPEGSLVLAGTTLYGMTQDGGVYGYGNIFSVGSNGLGYQDLYDFSGGTDGRNPFGDLTLSGGTLFGMAAGGGNLSVSVYGVQGAGTVFALALPANSWAKSGSGSWTTPGNWTSGTVPNGAGLQAGLGTSATASCTITLDGNQTVGSLTFNNGNAGYTLSAGSAGMLTLNNAGGATSQIVVLGGTHSITAPVQIANGTVTVIESAAGSLAISGNLSDDNQAESLILNGDGSGVLVLSGTNTYGGGTIVQAGTLVVTNRAALLDGSNLTVGANAGSLLAPPAANAPTAVPEPSTLALLGFATIDFMRRKWLRRETRAARTSTPPRL